MEQTLLILLLCCIILIIILGITLNKRGKKLEQTELEKKKIEVARKNELKDYFKEEWDREEKTLTDKFKVKTDGLDKEWQTRFQLHQSQLSNLDNEIKGLEKILKEKEKRYEEVNQDLEAYRKKQIEEIENSAKMYMEHKHHLIEESVDKYRLIKINEANSQLEQKQSYLNNLEEQINRIQNELEEERTKRAAINEELRKAEEKEKYNEIHSVQLTDNEKEDIHFLLSLEDRMHNKQVLYKLVWSTYLQQAYKNTFHNILGSRDPKNVIYCIENINTGKKYIGKTSAEVSKRWTEHIKTSLNIGTIKTTNIHKALYNHWDEFIFYIIIETEKDKLSEMEKYYINFYESDKYGYNIKAGG